MGSQCLTSEVTGRGVMVVKDNIEKKEEERERDINRNSDDDSEEEIRDSDHNNSVEQRSDERVRNVRLKKEENGDDEPDPVDLIRLQELIPSVAAKNNVTHLDIILEAIRYIDSLQDKLADKIERGEIVPLQVTGKRKRDEE